MNELIKPCRLRKGEKIGVFSPSCAATSWIPERTEQAIIFLEQYDYQVVRGFLTGKDAGYRSGSISERADELNMLIRDSSVRCIMAASGGFVSNSILPYIDYEALRRDPKIIVGFSDVTAVLLAIQEKAGLVTYYGPNLIPVFGEIPPWSRESFGYFEDMVVKKKPLPHVFKMPDMWTEDSVGLEEHGVQCSTIQNEWVCVRHGRVQGRLIGGNLDTLYGVWGSKYLPEIQKGDILYLEENRGNPEKIERAISHLKLCGVFDRIGGLIFGKSADYSDRGTGKKFWEVTMEILKEYTFPILAEFDCAHTKPMHTLPLGCMYELDSSKKQLILLEHGIK